MRAFVLLALLLLAAPLAASQAVVAVPRFEVGWTTEGLVATVTPEGEFHGGVLVWHVSPAGVTQVDGYAPVDAYGGQSVRLAFPAVDRGVSHQVTLLPESVAPRRLEGSTLFDGASVRDLPALRHASVEAQSPDAPLSFRLRSVMAQGEPLDAWGGRIAVSPQGAIVATYVSNRTLWAASSIDGGHTWWNRIPIFTGIGQRGVAWGVGPTGDGNITVAAHLATELDGPRGPGFWMVMTFEPRAGRWTQGFLAPIDQETDYAFFEDRTPVVVLPDGSVIVRAGGVNDQSHFWRLNATKATRLANVVVDNPNVFIVAARGQTIGVLVQRSTTQRLSLTQSTDGGATWSPLRELLDVTALAPGGAFPQQAAYSADGTLHAIVMGTSGASSVGLHVRVPPGEAPIVRRVPTEHGHAPRLATLGHDVLLVASDVNADQRGVYSLRRSFDGGRTFASRWLDARDGTGAPAPAYPLDLAVAPDGRAVLLAVDGSAITAGVESDPLLGATTQHGDPRPSSSTPAATTPPPATTPAPSTPAPEPAPSTPITTTNPLVSASEKHAFRVTPSVVRIANDGSAQVTVTFTNEGNGDMGSEAPTIRDLPPGVGASVEGSGWVLVRPGETKAYVVTLYASGAPNGTYVARAEGRRATDRPGMEANFTISVGAAAVLPPPPGGGGLSPELQQAILAALGAGGCAAAVIVVVRTDAGRWALVAATLPLYSRVSRGDVLNHEVRAGIHEFVTANPGARLLEIARGVGLGTSPLVFHLRVLEREGYVSVTREWTRRRYYATGAVPIHVRGPKDVASTLTALLASDPGIGAAEVARRLNMSRQLARYHLGALERKGVVRGQGEGSAKGYVLAGPR